MFDVSRVEVEFHRAFSRLPTPTRTAASDEHARACNARGRASIYIYIAVIAYIYYIYYIFYRVEAQK